MKKIELSFKCQKISLFNFLGCHKVTNSNLQTINTQILTFEKNVKNKNPFLKSILFYFQKLSFEIKSQLLSFLQILLLMKHWINKFKCFDKQNKDQTKINHEKKIHSFGKLCVCVLTSSIKSVLKENLC